MIKKVLYGKEARDKVLAGVNKIVDVVSVTLGAKGRNVIISNAEVVNYGTYTFPNHVTKDGQTCAKAFDLQDEFERVGVMAVKEASEKTVTQAGDGTTTCAVLLRAIVREGIKLIEAGANPMEVKKDIDKATEFVVEELKKVATPIKGDIEKIRQIATISANNDSSIGDLIADAFAKIGEEGIIDVEPSNGVKTEIKISDGYKFDKGWLSPLFVNKKEKQVTEYENPLLLLYDKRVTHHTQVQKAIEISLQAQKPIVVICEDADQEGLAFLAMNVIQGRLQCCVVTAPEFGEARRESMEDIAMLTGGTYLSDTKGVGIKNVTMNEFGKAKKVIVSKNETIIIGGEGDEDEIKELLNELRMNLVDAKSEEEKAPIEKRIAKLTGGVAVIQVGAATETEMKERLDRFDDATRAVKAAISEGYVIGAGTLFAKSKVDNVIFQAALKEPLKQICRNAGVDAVDILERVEGEEENFGYNAKTNQVENLLEAGVIDPVKVLRCSLQNAASSAGMLLTSEAVIVDTF